MLSLLSVDARIRGLSVEPLWERIPPPKLKLKGIDWVIVGGESGTKEHVRNFPLDDPTSELIPTCSPCQSRL